MKETSQKLLKWTKKDMVKVISIYVVNVFVMGFIFLLFEFINAEDSLSRLSDIFIHPQTLINFLILATLSALLMWVYFMTTDRNFLHDSVNSEMMFLILELSLTICLLLCKYVNYYFCPFAIAGLLTLFLTNPRNALFMNMMFGFVWVIFFSFLGMNARFNGSAEQTVLYYILNLSSGSIAVLVMNGVYSRFKVLAKSLFLSIPSVFVLLLSMFAYREFEFLPSFVSAVCSGPAATACFTLLLPIFEGIFNKVSCFRYSELTDHKAKFINKMITQAPGTFNHAIIVANITEACATAIGEDPLLARTCAYYHDVGKLRRPEFFKENQIEGVDAHEGLMPELSANIIRAHAKDGYDLLIKNRFPKQVADACLQHHGTLPILFFYDKAKKFTDGEVDIAQFRYLGPKPQTKIAAILMIADGAEAATRTLTDRSRENVEKVVRGIVNERMKLGQFDDCEITLNEITIIINAVINSLTGIYHSRIEYPNVSLEGLETDGSK